MNKENKYTLITGGSEGIGFELARLFAKDKNNIILVARNEEKLLRAKNKIEDEFEVEVKIMVCDLSKNDEVDKFIKAVDENNLSVDNLINNAGIGSFGAFHEAVDNFENTLININIISVTKLTKYFLKKMIKEGNGGIMNVASTAAFVGGPKMSMYYSSKAYVLTLTEAIHDEVKDKGIRISCLCPGPVKTSFQEKAGIKKSDKAKKYLMDAQQVAEEGYKGFLKGKDIIIPGTKNKFLILGNKLIPRFLSRKIIMNNNKE